MAQIQNENININKNNNIKKNDNQDKQIIQKNQNNNIVGNKIKEIDNKNIENKEKGKIISIGGDDHGKKEVEEKNGRKRRISKEGEQYQLGSQTGREVAELEWIKDTVISGKEFLKQVEEEHHYKARLKKIIERNRNESQKNPTNDKESEFQSEQGE